MIKDKKRIAISISDKDYVLLEQKAADCNLSINKYIKMKALDETDNVKLRREAAFVMAELYRWSELTEDWVARDYLKEGGDRLCQCLK